MRHGKDGRQFSRNTAHRRAMFRNLAGNLITHERLITTDAKAKELRRVAEKLITKAKRIGGIAASRAEKLSAGDKSKRLHVARLLGSFIPRWGVERDGKKRDIIEKVLVDLSTRMADREGGYTRIVKLGPRRGDGAAMSLIELVDAPPVQPLEAEPAAGSHQAEAAAP